jgi:hypothetical protein
MSEMEPTPLTSCTPSDSRWALVQRVADSSYFCKAPKLRAFLLYACENALLGRLENVREQLIGSKVFGRPAEYSLVEDNIVRVEARELRKRLEAFFAAEGRDEPVVIEIPKGGYVPVFKPREQAASAVLEPNVQEPVTPTGPWSLAPRWLVALFGAVLLLTTGAAGWLVFENLRLRRQTSEVTPGAAAADYSFYPDLLGNLGAIPEREALLVLSNPRLAIYYGADSMAPIEQTPGRTILAPKELKTTFGFALRTGDRELPFHFLTMSRGEYTGVGEATAAFHLGRLMHFLRRPVRLTQQRFVNWDHLQKQDLIILGGPQSNDWTYQADIKSEFNFLPGFIENVRPRPGEQKRYPGNSDPGPDVADYGVIKMLASPYGFRMLLLAGRSSAGTAGVAQFFSDPAKLGPVYNLIHAAAPGRGFPSNWEVLLKITVRDTLPMDTTVVALRPASPAH